MYFHIMNISNTPRLSDTTTCSKNITDAQIPTKKQGKKIKDPSTVIKTLLLQHQDIT
jgi:hypothetical protein